VKLEANRWLQVLAMGAANMMMFNLALPFSLSTLVIANLHRSGVELSMDDVLASWFGETSRSLIYCLLFYKPLH
jgi:hypothetical protein